MKRNRPALIPVVLLALTALFTLFAPAAPAAPAGDAGHDPGTWAADYLALGEWQFCSSPSTIPEGGVRIENDVAEWELQRGSIRPMQPTSDGSVTGFIFEGAALFRMDIPDPVEVNQLHRYGVRTIGDALEIAHGRDCTVTRMVVRTTDPFVTGLFPAAGSTMFGADTLAENRHLWWLEHARFDADARVIAGLLNNDREYLAIDFETEEYGWLFYEFDPWRMEEVRLCRMRKAYDFVEVWVSLDRAEHRRADGRPGSERTPLVDLVHADLEVDLTRHKKRASREISRGSSASSGSGYHGMGTGEGSGSFAFSHGRRDREYPKTRFTARMTFTAQEDGLRALPLRLNPLAWAVTATDAEGRELPVLRAPIGRRFSSIMRQEADTALVVILHQPLASGDSAVIDFSWERRISNYPGTHDPYPVYNRPHLPYLAGGGQDWYPPLTYQSGRYWYPEPLEGRDDRHTARVTIIHPKKLRVRGTGKTAGSRQEGKAIFSTWVAETPIKSAGFSYGKRYKERRVLVDGVPEIIAFGPNYWNVLGDETESVAAHMADIIQFYQQTFDFTLPLETVTCASVSGSSQSYSDFLGLSSSTFGHVYHWRDEQRMANLAAKLYWGEMLDWESYRDKWLASALSQYSAILYLEAVDGIWGPRRERDVQSSARYLEAGWRLHAYVSSYRNRYVGPLEVGFRDTLPELISARWSRKPTSVYVNEGRYTEMTSYVRRNYLRNSKKRTSVLHMLRGILRNSSEEGDDRLFLDILSTFLAEHAGKTASTRAFIETVERKTGEDWDWFFDQWVYRSGVPRYDWSYGVSVVPDAGGNYQLTIQVDVGGVEPGFRMPIAFGLEYENAESDLLHMNVDQPTNSITIDLPNKPVNVIFDPYQDLLYVQG